MSTAAAERTSRADWITEDVRISSGHKIDREKGVIYGAKILGLKSLNGRAYLPEAVKAAAPLYEGRGVNVDHPARPDQPRSSKDRFGWFENVRFVEGSGLFGDFHLINPKTEFAVSVLNAAEVKPDLYGFSHNVQADTRIERDGLEVVHRIAEVRSVDLVADPATTHGLFEARNAMSKKVNVKKYLTEKVVPALQGKRQAKLKKLLEDDSVPAEMEMDEPAAGASADDGLRTAINAILEDSSLSADEKAKRIKDFLKLGEKHAGAADAQEEEEPDEKKKPTEEAECPDEKKGKDEYKEQVEHLRRKDLARDLCEESDVKCSKPLLEALIALGSEPKMKAHIEYVKGLSSGKPAKNGSQPRSSAGGSGAGRAVTESRAGSSGEIPETVEGQMAFLRS